jgi:hypothetical protein
MILSLIATPIDFGCQRTTLDYLDGAKVCRRRIAIQPFRVIRERPRAVFARNPRSRSRSTTAEGGRPFLKNAKLVKNVRSPRCKSRSIHERDFSRSSNCAPRARKSVARKLTPKLSTGNSYVRYLTVCQKVPSIKPVASGAASGDLTAQTIGQSWRQQSRCRFGLVLLKALSPETTY